MGDGAPRQNPSLIAKGSLLTHSTKLTFSSLHCSCLLSARKERINCTPPNVECVSSWPKVACHISCLILKGQTPEVRGSNRLEPCLHRKSNNSFLYELTQINITSQFHTGLTIKWNEVTFHLKQLQTICSVFFFLNHFNNSTFFGKLRKK